MKFNHQLAYIISCILLFTTFNSFAQGNACSVTGNISGITREGKITISRSSTPGSVPVKTAVIKNNGDFSFTLPAILLNDLYDLRIEGMQGDMKFIAEKGNVKIKGKKNLLYKAEISGSPENDRWNSYQKFLIDQSTKSNEMTMGGDKFTREERLALFYKQQADKKNYADSLIRNHPKSVVSLYVAQIPLMMLKHNQIDSLLAVFKAYFPAHKYFIAMKTRADILRKVAPGAIAPDFTVIKPDGKTKISLASFRGKYVLLDFWASWCVPCREENVHTKKLYEKFKSHGLEIISFSLDSDLKAWKEALEKDGLVWHNASDLVGGTKSPVAKKYGIDGIPAIWLIDPNGKIVVENVTREALEKELESIYANSKS